METEQESISALFFNLFKECQISSVLAPKGGSMITTSFSQLIRKFWRTASACSPWKACELKKLYQMKLPGEWNAWHKEFLMTTSDIRILPATVHQGQEEEICMFLEEVQRSRGSRYTRRQWTSVSILSQRRNRLSLMKRSAGPLFCQLPVMRRSSSSK